MIDRVPTQVLANGARRYGIYNSSGVLQEYQYLKLEDAPTEAGTNFDKSALLSVSVQQSWNMDDYATMSDLFEAITEAVGEVGAANSEAQIINGGVDTDALADKCITSEKLADGVIPLIGKCVTQSNLANSSVGTDQLVNYSVTSGKLASFAVTETRIADGAVTVAKLRSIARTITSSCTNEQIPTAKAVWNLFQ